MCTYTCVLGADFKTERAASFKAARPHHGMRAGVVCTETHWEVYRLSNFEWSLGPIDLQQIANSTHRLNMPARTVLDVIEKAAALRQRALQGAYGLHTALHLWYQQS